MSSITRALAANTAVQVFGKVVSTVIGIIVVGLMTRLLGTEGFGAYSTANAYLQIFAILLDTGLNVMVVQMLGERAGDKDYENKIVSAIFSLRFWSALLILSIAPVIGLLLPYSMEIKLAFFAIWASFFFTMLNQIVIGVSQRHLKMHVVAIAEVVGRTILLAGVLIATVFHWGLIPVVLIVSLGGIANFFVNFLVVRTYANFNIGFQWDTWKLVLKRSWPIGLSIIFSLVYFKADTLVLSLMRPQAEVGIYGAAYRVLEILATLPYMYAGVLLPIIANAWAKRDKEKFAYLIRRSVDAFSILVFPLVAGTLLVADRMMTLVAGPEFLESGKILQILIIATGIIYFAVIFNHAIVAEDKQKTMLPIYIVTSILTLIGYITLIPVYGMYAAAWLTVASETCILISGAIVSLRTAKTNISWNIPLKALLASIVMVFAARPLVDISLGLTILVAVLVYAIIIFATGALTKEMIRELVKTSKGSPTGDVILG